MKEVFEQEKYDHLLRHWKPQGLVHCSDPTVSCIDLFDPKIAVKVENSSWVVDFSPMAIDTEGWMYDRSFAGLDKADTGCPASRWDSQVRRRKWIHRANVGSNEQGIVG